MTPKIEKLAQESADSLIESFRSILGMHENISNQKLEESDFKQDLLNYTWNSLSDLNLLETNRDVFTDLVLKTVVSDIFAAESELREPTGGISEKSGICMVALDFIFYSRRNRKTPTSWSIAYFGLFSQVLSLLSWPLEITEFWPYTESRIEWLKMNTSLDPIPLGSTNLISYKQPLYERLRIWNTLLTKISNNTKLNTPAHYTIKYKFEKLLSELLPIHDESNFNRSGSINDFNVNNIDTKELENRSNMSSREGFVYDYSVTCERVFANPVQLYFKSSESKESLEKFLTPLVSAILDMEDDFYKQIKSEKKKISNMNVEMNQGFPVSFDYTNNNYPKYMEVSTKIEEERTKYWSQFYEENKKNNKLIKHTVMDMSHNGVDAFYQQFVAPSNDFYRKQFILQILFVTGIIRNVSKSSDIKAFYRICQQKNNPSKNIGETENESTTQTGIVSFFNYLFDQRIVSFYRYRDPTFLNILKMLMKSDTIFLNSKSVNYKEFSGFLLNNEEIHEFQIDSAFKKFNFIKLGNKEINNIWKIQTGIDRIEKKNLNIGHLYEGIKSKWESNEPSNIPSEDRMVKQWQNLRNLRSTHLYELKNVDETTGENGLFDNSLINASKKKKEAIRDQLIIKLQEPHLKELQVAREFIKENDKKKRVLEEERQRSLSKKPKVDDQSENQEKTETEMEIEVGSEPTDVSKITNIELEKKNSEQNEPSIQEDTSKGESPTSLPDGSSPETAA